jgi:excisionase family DNA binding protein
MKSDQLPDIMTVDQVAKHQQVHRNKIYALCTSGELKSYKSGNSRRIRKEAYLEWIAKLEQAN